LSDTPRLLEGVRVLSFGSFIAGNTAGRLLADLGAEVVKIEARTRPEVLRTAAYAIGEAVTEPSGIPSTVMYTSLTRGLRNISLELASSDARALLRRLVGVADIVIENFGSPVLDRWGLGYGDLLKENPRLVMLSLSGYGRSGPRANYVAYGKTISSYTGLAATWGYTHGTLPDYLAAATGALAAVAALYQAWPRGIPVYLDVAQIDALTPLLAPIYAAPLNTGQDTAQAHNTVPGSWLSGIFPSRGHDRWLAVDLEDQSDWESLCRYLDRPDLVVGTREEALVLESELSRALADWATECSPHAAMHHLQRAGLAAAVVQDTEDLWRDIQLRARNFVEPVFQGDVGSVMYAGSPQRWSTTPGAAPIPPARLGQHTREILQGWLGAVDSEIDALEASGAIFSTS
jgi:crotonobetainyl-CoA:carnitine CoA-transferase CaiB-like acyl-CoA transferase